MIESNEQVIEEFFAEFDRRVQTNPRLVGLRSQLRATADRDPEGFVHRIELFFAELREGNEG